LQRRLRRYEDIRADCADAILRVVKSSFGMLRTEARSKQDHDTVSTGVTILEPADLAPTAAHNGPGEADGVGGRYMLGAQARSLPLSVRTHTAFAIALAAAFWLWPRTPVFRPGCNRAGITWDSPRHVRRTSRTLTSSQGAARFSMASRLPDFSHLTPDEALNSLALWDSLPMEAIQPTTSSAELAGGARSWLPTVHLRYPGNRRSTR